MHPATPDVTLECLDDAVAGAVNLRDLGGYPASAGRIVRRGVVFRSGMMHAIEPHGLRVLRTELGVASIIDLRNEIELEEDGIAPFRDHGIAHHHASVMTGAFMDPERMQAMQARIQGGEGDFGTLYQTMAMEGAGAFRRLFEVLAEPGALPAVFHCTGGRDRTGVAAALILGLVGVEPEVIAADYARSGALLERHRDRQRNLAYMRRMAAAGVAPEEIFRMSRNTEPQHMLELLVWLEAEHGSVRGYLGSIGVSEAILSTVEQALVE